MPQDASRNGEAAVSMKAWLPDPVVTHPTNGGFVRWDLEIGENKEEFLQELGRRTMEAYIRPIKVYGSVIERGQFDARRGPFDVKRYARRLFDPGGSPKPVFKEYAGEILAAWCDESFSPRTCGLDPIPHDNTPCFDSISYETRDDGAIVVCLVQAKTSRSNPGSEANKAARKLGLLEQGRYDRELSAALEKVADLFPLEEQRRSVMDAVLSADLRHYTIVAVHEVEPPKIVLTRYDQHVKGDMARRRGAFLRVAMWDEAWATVAEAAYAEINS